VAVARRAVQRGAPGRPALPAHRPLDRGARAGRGGRGAADGAHRDAARAWRRASAAGSLLGSLAAAFARAGARARLAAARARVRAAARDPGVQRPLSFGGPLRRAAAPAARGAARRTRRAAPRASLPEHSLHLRARSLGTDRGRAGGRSGLVERGNAADPARAAGRARERIHGIRRRRTGGHR
jgi:hypothetical protein